MATATTKLDMLKTYYNEYLVICKIYLGKKMVFDESEETVDLVTLYDLIHTHFKTDDIKHNRIEFKKLLLYKQIIFTDRAKFTEFFGKTEEFIQKILIL